jgi:hypothetical protein
MLCCAKLLLELDTQGVLQVTPHGMQHTARNALSALLLDDVAARQALRRRTVTWP